MTVSLDDREGIVEQLRRIALREFAQPFEPRNTDRFAYPYVAEQMARVVEEAVATRASRS